MGKSTDVYALGAVPYELFGVNRPIWAQTIATLHRVKTQEPTHPASQAGGAVTSKPSVQMLGERTAGRYATARALGDDLRRYISGLPTLVAVAIIIAGSAARTDGGVLYHPLPPPAVCSNLLSLHAFRRAGRHDARTRWGRAQQTGQRPYARVFVSPTKRHRRRRPAGSAHLRSSVPGDGNADPRIHLALLVVFRRRRQRIFHDHQARWFTVAASAN